MRENPKIYLFGRFQIYVRGNFLGKFPLKPLQTFLFSVKFFRLFYFFVIYLIQYYRSRAGYVER